MRSNLQVQIDAVNQAHQYAPELYAKLAKVFTDLVGKKILKADGQFIASVREMLPDLPNQFDLSVYRRVDDYSLRWTIKTCQNTEKFTHYYEYTVYVGKLSKGVLTAIEPFVAPKCDYREEDIVAARKRVQDAEKAISEAKMALYPFDRY